MNTSQLPGSRWLATWVRDPTLRSGILVGAYLTAIMLGSLLLANRVPLLEPFAKFRNLFCAAVFLLAAILPVWRWRDSATPLFISGTLGWLIFSLMYWATGMYFIRLHTRFHRPMQVFLIGAVLYGLAAVTVWVTEMVRHARTQPINASRRRPY